MGSKKRTAHGPYPTSQDDFFRAWEVKVGMLYAVGSTKSLKNGKLDKTVSQLRKYREFGVPTCSLLEVYLCETGLLGTTELLLRYAESDDPKHYITVTLATLPAGLVDLDAEDVMELERIRAKLLQKEADASLPSGDVIDAEIIMPDEE